MEPYGSGDAAELQAYADELRAGFLRMQQEIPALHERARTLQVTEKSPDGLISATVGARGDLVRLDIDPRVYRRPDSRQLADTITATVQSAAAKARERVVEIFAPLIPGEQMKAHLEGDLQAVLDQMTARLPGER
ncbi:YbaB/EbfC family nucleoid-associated protein [Sphaerisporangium aureirubrum]|uniref:YbaB/EbfC family nucleoid-associated protein n=1 Tax=Sphaerisporangium aureirubrum TaxID=1544736 RepID=A0ABW1NID3_9ACTN